MALVDVWKKVVEKVQTQVDRVTHASDRRRARHRAVRRGRPRRIIIVCYGNICRSPYAATYLRRRLDDAGLHAIAVDSAGLFGADRPANRQGSVIAEERGLDLRAHRSKLFRAVDGEAADLVLVMTRSQRAELFQVFGVPGDRLELLGDFDVTDRPEREIRDPYGQSDAEFRRVFTQLEDAVDGLCLAWGVPLDSRRDPATPAPR